LSSPREHGFEVKARYSGDGDAAVATGKMRQLQYRLIAGEASWQLELVNSTEF
jgi:hypothetical protein